jgi:hypothetical protein
MKIFPIFTLWLLLPLIPPFPPKIPLHPKVVPLPLRNICTEKSECIQRKKKKERENLSVETK